MYMESSCSRRHPRAFVALCLPVHFHRPPLHALRARPPFSQTNHCEHAQARSNSILFQPWLFSQSPTLPPVQADTVRERGESAGEHIKARKLAGVRTSSLATELFSRARSSSAAVADSGAAEGALRASSSFLWSVCFSTSLAAICCAEHASVSKRAKGKCSSSNARLLERFDVSVHVAC